VSHKRTHCGSNSSAHRQSVCVSYCVSFCQPDPVAIGSSYGSSHCGANHGTHVAPLGRAHFRSHWIANVITDIVSFCEPNDVANGTNRESDRIAIGSANRSPFSVPDRAPHGAPHD